MVKLYQYQKDLLQRAEKALKAPDARVMLQLPTGGGKTRIAAALLDGWVRNGGKAAWLTHRRELSDQTCQVLDESGVLAVSRPEWDFYDLAPGWEGWVVILMTQTVSRRNHFEGVWDEYGSEDLLIVDEAHHAPARGWERAINQWARPGDWIDRYAVANREIPGIRPPVRLSDTGAANQRFAIGWLSCRCKGVKA